MGGGSWRGKGVRVRHTRFVRRSVSGDREMVKVVGVKEVMVRQVPLMEMESPGVNISSWVFFSRDVFGFRLTIVGITEERGRSGDGEDGGAAFGGGCEARDF